MKSTSIHTLLDVGGYVGFWSHAEKFCDQLDVVNIDVAHKTFEVDKHIPWIRTTYANGCELPYLDQSYDIVFSNSVIEHLGNWENQKKFSHEVMRVGKKIWIQTPAYEFFMEPHYITPFVHWFSKNIRRKILRWVTVWGWIEKPDQSTVNASIDEIKLLRFEEFQSLFPECTIIRENFLGVFTKSYIAVRSGLNVQ